MTNQFPLSTFNRPLDKKLPEVFVTSSKSQSDTQMTDLIEQPVSLDQISTKHEITRQEISDMSQHVLELLSEITRLNFSCLFFSLHSPVHQHPEEKSLVKIILFF